MVWTHNLGPQTGILVSKTLWMYVTAHVNNVSTFNHISVSNFHFIYILWKAVEILTSMFPGSYIFTWKTHFLLYYFYLFVFSRRPFKWKLLMFWRRENLLLFEIIYFKSCNQDVQMISRPDSIRSANRKKAFDTIW